MGAGAIANNGGRLRALAPAGTTSRRLPPRPQWRHPGTPPLPEAP